MARTSLKSASEYLSHSPPLGVVVDQLEKVGSVQVGPFVHRLGEDVKGREGLWVNRLFKEG